MQALLRALADELEASGDLRSPQWRAAVEQVPRHVFLPRFYTAAPNAQGFTEYTPVTPEISGLDEWLTLAYQNETWVTQLDHSDGSWDTPGAVTGIPTSSSTLPGVVVRMLEDLQVYDGARVLEIGTGTGYSTALLCARLGDDLVTSVEYDAVLSAAAASRLASLGYRPALVVGDGAHGHPPGVPYDRVIATCSFTHVPPAWVE
ncbi:Protein-L-isoaspartate O-methyltransferase [Carbonactinospora thermoautotrophica]|nr:Protein-L-isoaspartate O-methyltransferase [Carbonactinospora thermoautotrophica]